MEDESKQQESSASSPQRWAESQQTALTVLTPFPGRCQVRVLPPVPTEGLKPDDVPALADMSCVPLAFWKCLLHQERVGGG